MLSNFGKNVSLVFLHSINIPYTRSGRGATEIPTMEMPGVPSYDNSERQLLASLEQELGVL